MRLLGKCPNCGKEDTLVVECPNFPQSFEKIVRCEKCAKMWKDWISLSSEERKRGNKLIPVEVVKRESSVELYWQDIYEIPWGRLAASVVNTALMTRFKLGVCISTEGGVQGRIGREPIELRNVYAKIGLYDEYSNSQIRREWTNKILNWYGDLLRYIFEKKLYFNKQSFGRGAILKLTNRSEDEPKARFYLWLAIRTKARSSAFADRVFKKLFEAESNPFSARYLAGLSDEDIAKLFVPPPVTVVTGSRD